MIRSVKSCGAAAQLDCVGPSEGGDLADGDGGGEGGDVNVELVSLRAHKNNIPKRNLVLINRHNTYAHNDPAGAFPNNVFFDHLVPFLSRIAR